MLKEKMLRVMGDVNREVAERTELVECIAIALLTRKNLFILGDTGQAKSYAINEFRKRITGAKQYERLLSKQTDEEALFGRIDLKSLIDGNPRMITTGKIPDSHIVFLDEIFKSNEGVLNSLLTALNERRYTNESETVDIPAVSFMSASNEIPNFSDPAEKILKPLYDRFELKIITRYIESREKRLEMLALKQNAGTSQATPASFSLDELYSMQREVSEIEITGQVNELMDDLLCELRRLGIHISDRKYLNYSPIVRAKAWLDGRKSVIYTDLLVLKNYLWTTPEEITVIEQTLERLCVNPMQDKLREIEAIAKDTYDDFFDNKDNRNALKKFRSEMVKVYDMATEQLAKAANDIEKQTVSVTLDELERLSKLAHEKSIFTYAPLSELKELAS
jgi:MoxR-like ATPase